MQTTWVFEHHETQKKRYSSDEKNMNYDALSCFVWFCKTPQNHSVIPMGYKEEFDLTLPCSRTVNYTNEVPIHVKYITEKTRANAPKELKLK